MPDTPRTAIFTIAARNYLHFARTLMESVACHAPSAHRFLGLCDRPDPAAPPEPAFDILDPTLLDIPDPKPFFFQYTLLELSTAIKPYLITHLMQQRGYDRVIYFDPDIKLYAPLHDLLSLLDHHPLVLTPHLTAPLTDTKRPSEADILKCGAYNLGFAAFAKSPQTLDFLHWWQTRLHNHCIVDFPNALFVDQKWMDLAPSLLPGTFIQHHPGWNVAYWNLPHRTVQTHGDTCTVNQQPLHFFHFSGFDPATGVFSKHQDRYTPDNLPPAVAALARDYAHDLRRHGYPETKSSPNAFAAFPDGTPIPDAARRIYRENKSTLAPRFPDPAGADAPAYIHYLNQPADLHGASHPAITRIAYDAYLHGPDLGLREQFPDLAGAHAIPFAQWLIGPGQDFIPLPPAFLHPIRHALHPSGSPPATSSSPSPAKWLYKQAWRFKHLTHWILPLPLRQKIHGWMFRRAFVQPQTTPAAPTPRNFTPPGTPPGLNLIGYLQAELGIGEAARSLGRAAAAAHIPVTPRNFTTGSTSRMAEPLDFLSPPPHPDHPINLIALNAEQIPYAIAEFDPSYFQSRYNIAVWNWELPHLPETWLDSTRYLNEIWAPSAFCHEAFSQRLHLPVVRMPYAIDIHPDPAITRHTLNLPPDPFLFLFMFDVLSVPERKNPLGLIHAFLEAAPAFNRPATLVLKMINADKDTPTLRAVRQAAATHPNILLIDRYLTRPQLNGLFNVVDAYASLHRSEGFGLTLAESMALAKPVLGTAWSSTLDFMTPRNSYLVDYTLTELDRDYGPYKKGQVWAEPDLHHAATLLADIVNHPQEAAARARRAQADIQTNYSPTVIGQRIRSRLTHILQTT